MSEVNRPTETPSQDKAIRMWAMILHLSLLLNFILPIAGVVVPILIWQIKKNDFPIIDAHGKNAVNWLISAVIYSFVSGLLMLVMVGIVGLIIVGVLAIVFPIIAGIKANNGEVWKYPLSITFLK